MRVFEKHLRVAIDSVETMTPSAFERFLEECDSAGLDLTKAKDYVLRFPTLNPYTRKRVPIVYSNYIDSL